MNQTVTEPCPLYRREVPPPPPPPPITIRGSLFFDGTGNNRANTAYRIEHPYMRYAMPALSSGLSLTGSLGQAVDIVRTAMPSTFSGSFDNDYTNVVKLERFLNIPIPGPDHSFKIYIEGIGTTNLAFDDLIAGTALGLGSTGVKSKVNRGLNEAVQRIRGFIHNRRSPVTIQLDAFGFSRGAAAARYFVYQALIHETGRNIVSRLTNEGYNITDIQFKFVGLFDSVASLGRDHGDDTAELHLDSITSAAQVVHLAAADEHRLNFPLTDIRSKGGIELFLPGVHSDIGGGYQESTDEDGLVVYHIGTYLRTIPTVMRLYAQKLQAEKERLIASGWYNANEIEVSWNCITVTRSNILNHYNRIPLRLMKNFAGEQGLTFQGNLERRNPILGGLFAAYSRIGAYAASKRGGGSTVNDWSGNDLILKSLRHDYFHSSAHYEISSANAMRPQFHSGRFGWTDGVENRMSGTRTRRPYAG